MGISLKYTHIATSNFGQVCSRIIDAILGFIGAELLIFENMSFSIMELRKK